MNGWTATTSKNLRAPASYSWRACPHCVETPPSATNEPATTFAPRSALWIAGYAARSSRV